MEVGGSGSHRPLQLQYSANPRALQMRVDEQSSSDDGDDGDTLVIRKGVRGSHHQGASASEVLMRERHVPRNTACRGTGSGSVNDWHPAYTSCEPRTATHIH